MRAVVIGAHRHRDDIDGDAVAIPLADLFLSGVEIAPQQPVSERELLLRVAGIRAQLLARATFVAIRYGFVLTNESEAMTKCGAQVDRWRRLLDEHRNEVELTLKVAAAAPLPRPNRTDFANGAGYLRALHAATQGAAIDESFRAAVDAQLVPLANDHRWIHRDNASMELALLVARERVEEVNAAGAKLKSFDVPFLLSGPWPLEVFVDDHE
ncbi:MAG: hypothetical protein QOI24_3709 [Acidobacteriota bacterium]|jgi:hypothetical protein|nr:hypothetical protein [Acidobacteriota bacterium]